MCIRPIALVVEFSDARAGTSPAQLQAALSQLSMRFCRAFVFHWARAWMTNWPDWSPVLLLCQCVNLPSKFAQQRAGGSPGAPSRRPYGGALSARHARDARKLTLMDQSACERTLVSELSPSADLGARATGANDPRTAHNVNLGKLREDVPRWITQLMPASERVPPIPWLG